ncbi:hypothetical protein [Stenotrophomonas nematodicola]|uniref:Uncharacterized protein n=1 Tax=Stenotrophomonas nematodicola TaxID=2656746 RepID=A0ABW7D271_9GAMM
MTSLVTRMLLFAALLPLAACARPPAQKPAELTQTNEQGCTRQRSVGPQDPYADPVPLKQACLGPYLLAFPQNYFYNQIGTEHDGSYSLALEYPSLQPFKPGERMGLTADVSARTVMVKYTYIDGGDARDALTATYVPMEYQRGMPQETLDGRTKGTPSDGLTPYYVDMEKVRAHYRMQGLRETAPVMNASFHTDWFIARNEDGEVSTVIKCAPREVAAAGVASRQAKAVKSEGVGVPRCSQTFMNLELDTLITVRYPREGLTRWRKIEQRATELLARSITVERKEAQPWPVSVK